MRKYILIVAVFVIAILGAVVVLYPHQSAQQPRYDMSISDGTITVSYPSDDFGLATNPQQILSPSFIPQCDENFLYCLYYIGKDYEHTNFEGAGIRISKRNDLTTERLCVFTPPGGLDSSAVPSATSSDDRSTRSVFKGLGTAATGHTAEGTVHRLYVRATSSCYEFETRVAQFRYEPGIPEVSHEFTPNDKAALESRLEDIVNTITLS